MSHYPADAMAVFCIKHWAVAALNSYFLKMYTHIPNPNQHYPTDEVAKAL